ncbi:MAG: carboxypeptidase regulatory-like domain-containing protein [Clostridia bacterium]|nr:carboxypeptidase regulatory-like domain-containing protein [Clostridia bacterium]
MELEKDMCPIMPITHVDGFISSGKQYDIDIHLPEDNRSVIYGVIKDCYDEPVADAVVKLIELERNGKETERKPVTHTFTDKQGQFVFGPLCANKFYEIEIWANKVKHKKISTTCEHHGKCLKGEELDIKE